MSKILCVLDGLGFSVASSNNVLSLANLPNFKSILAKYSWITLNSDGEYVGQEAGLVGNSEVGHMNLGGLRLVPQLSYQITKSSQNSFNLDKNITPDQLFDPKVFLKNKFEKTDTPKTVHLIGLFSTGTIHSDLRHWAGAIEAASNSGADKIVMHIISDGRDSDRQSLVATWDSFVTKFQTQIKPFENKIFLGSLGGRFYSMDRDQNWDRVFQSLVTINTDVNDTIINLNKYPEDTLLKDIWSQLEELKYRTIKNKFGIASFDDETFRLFMIEKLANLKIEMKYEDVTVKDYSKIIQKTIDSQKLMTEELSKLFDSPFEVIKQTLEAFTTAYYNRNTFDEHLPPVVFEPLNKNDTIWLLNFRTDRMKQFSQMLCDINQEFELGLDILGMNDYCVDREIYLDQSLVPTRSKTQIGYYPVFKNQPVSQPMAKYLSENGKTQLHIAETEKYNHVTYFFNGGQNQKWENENWVVINSNKVTSHSEKPEMKAKEITDYIIENGLGKYDYIIVNYANPDMIGHTGDIKAGVQSMEFLDTQLGRLVQKVVTEGHELIITADHGNIEFVGEFLKNGKILTDTEHNPNLVPCIFVSPNFDSQKLINNLQNSGLNIDSSGLDNLKIALNSDNRVELNQDTWLTQNQIPTSNLPLWIAGLCLVGL